MIKHSFFLLFFLTSIEPCIHSSSQTRTICRFLKSGDLKFTTSMASNQALLPSSFLMVGDSWVTKYTCFFSIILSWATRPVRVSVLQDGYPTLCPLLYLGYGQRFQSRIMAKSGSVVEMVKIIIVTQISYLFKCFLALFVYRSFVLKTTGRENRWDIREFIVSWIQLLPWVEAAQIFFIFWDFWCRPW